MGKQRHCVNVLAKDLWSMVFSVETIPIRPHICSTELYRLLRMRFNYEVHMRLEQENGNGSESTHLKLVRQKQTANPFYLCVLFEQIRFVLSVGPVSLFLARMSS